MSDSTRDPEGQPGDPQRPGDNLYGEPTQPAPNPYGAPPSTPPTYNPYSTGPATGPATDPGTQPYGAYPQQPGGQPYGTQAYGAQPYGAQPGYPQQPGYPAAPYGYGVPVDHPKATHALVWGLVSLIGGFICALPLLVSPVAWVVGRNARREIDAQPGLGGRGQATAGMVMGIIGTVLLLLGIAFFVLIIVLGLSGAFDSSTTYGETGNL